MPSRSRRDPRRVPTLRRVVRTRNAAMRDVLDTVAKVLDHDVSLLILGESGSGKDFLAQAIHACGTRRERPFVTIECASIPPELFESELFGYEKGTFTDAQSRKLGKLESAGSGTVYFDEIAALTPPLQAKLLRAIQERAFTRLGGHEPIRFAGRVITSSNDDLSGLRRDLFYRINVVTITLPPLRDRREDVALLATQFAKQASKTIAADAMKLLTAYTWPGNVRELRNVIERAAILEDGERITPASLPLDRIAGAPALVASAKREKWTLDELESHYIREVLRETKSNYSKAALVLGINRKTLLEKRRKYGLE